MDLLAKYALSQKDIIKPDGVVDVLLFYWIVSRFLEKMLDKKEIASRIWLPSEGSGYVLKRGSNNAPLYARDLAQAVTIDLLRLRREGDLTHSGSMLSETQRTV